MTITLNDLLEIKAAMISNAETYNRLAKHMESRPETAERLRGKSSHFVELAEQFIAVANEMLDTGRDKRIAVKF